MSSLNWWNNLEQQWKQAFEVTFFRSTATPSISDLEQLQNTTVLRLVGPRAPYPNMDFELTNLSGIAALQQLEILVVTHQQIKDLQLLASLKNLKSLFLFNNQIESLEGIEGLTDLEQLYIQFNNIASLTPLQQLTQLKEVYIHHNALTSLDGLTETHSDNLATFFCLPNSGLKQKEIIRAENHLGIRCRSV
ncbi:leucine-rich repeat domain-containing protein [Niabella sp. CC-SYL272]|uniref:leucine-rich repeat domain-containing protein n=1 Tax=Niabella agricola TaxID=2891571 RepID=UPI001F1B11E3|nr:leucine-rich repeat domain-containing protein [Niabella agricola]MCF3111447.1 leucine-rich repeat domain-containing protein [Niabella agricola]